MANTEFDDIKIHVKAKLSALWVTLMLCYIYGDYFGLYVPGALQNMLDGNMGPLGKTTQNILLGTSFMMAIPSLMVFLSLVLKPAVSRWLNILLGSIYTAIILMTMPGAWNFYVFLGVIEAMLSLLIVWTAWHWPKQTSR